MRPKVRNTIGLLLAALQCIPLLTGCARGEPTQVDLPHQKICYNDTSSSALALRAVPNGEWICISDLETYEAMADEVNANVAEGEEIAVALDAEFFNDYNIIAVNFQEPGNPLFDATLAGFRQKGDTLKLTMKLSYGDDNEVQETEDNIGYLFLFPVQKDVTNAVIKYKK